MSASSICQRLLHRGLGARVPLNRITSRQTIDDCVGNGLICTNMSFQMNYASICGTMITAFVLDAMPVNVAFQRALSQLINSGLTPGVMVWDVISYHGRYYLLRIEGNFNNNRYIREVLQPEVVSFLQGIHGAVFQQGNARPDAARTVRPNACNVFLGLLICRIRRLLSPFEIWLVRVLQLQKMNFCYAYEKYGLVFHKQTFKICLNPCYTV
ncbi:uncharacterized protein TNCV_5013381 [Trichonephila clavipes]|nr:uncharacterized protein TNCV_5013381 [Trichonephila clavipes]